MSAAITQLDPRTEGLRLRVFGIYVLLAAFNIGAWVWAFIAFHSQPLLLGTGLIAWGFRLAPRGRR